MPAIEKLSGPAAESESFLALLEALELKQDATLDLLVESMRETLRQEACRAYNVRKSGRTTSGKGHLLLTGLSQDPAEDWELASDPAPRHAWARSDQE